MLKIHDARASPNNLVNHWICSLNRFYIFFFKIRTNKMFLIFFACILNSFNQFSNRSQKVLHSRRFNNQPFQFHADYWLQRLNPTQKCITELNCSLFCCIVQCAPLKSARLHLICTDNCAAAVGAAHSSPGCNYLLQQNCGAPSALSCEAYANTRDVHADAHTKCANAVRSIANSRGCRHFWPYISSCQLNNMDGRVLQHRRAAAVTVSSRWEHWWRAVHYSLVTMAVGLICFGRISLSVSFS